MHGAAGVDRLWAFWKDRNMWDGDPMWYASLPPGGNWSGSRIYLTYKGGYNGDILVKQMDSSNNWSPEQTVLYSTTDNPPSAVWFNGALWIFWQSNYDLQVYYQTFNL